MVQGETSAPPSGAADPTEVPPGENQDSNVGNQALIILTAASAVLLAAAGVVFTKEKRTQ